MNVVIITQYFHPEVGATQSRMASFADAFTQAGDSVTVITELPNHPHGVIREGYRGRLIDRRRENGYDVIRTYVLASSRKTFWRRMAFYLSFMVSSFIAGLHSPLRPNVIVATSPPIFSAVSGWLLARLRGARFVLDVRDLWPDAAEGLGQLRNRHALWLARTLERFLYRRADLISTVTSSFEKIISGDRRAAPVLLVPNGTHPGLFSPSRSDPLLRKTIGLEDQFLAGFAGNLGLAQDLDSILETARLLRDDPSFAFLIIGAGPEETRIRKKAEALKLDNVVFHPQVPLREVPPFLLACDVLLVTLRKVRVLRSFVPSKLFDFMACQRPVICNVEGEAREIVRESRAGVAIPGGDALALKESLVNLSRDPLARRRMGKNGRAYVIAVRDRNKIVRAFVSRLHRDWDADGISS